MTFPGLNRAQINALITTSLGDYYTSAEVDTAFAALGGVYASASHNHNASAITTGTLDAARLPDLSLVYAPIDHDHDLVYAAIAHTHDDRYYTEAEADALLAGKASASHNHDLVYAALAHAHDAGDVTSGVFSNARINWAAPGAIGGTTKAAGSFTTLSAWHPAPTGTAGGISLKGYNPNEGGYASMELSGTSPAWTTGKGIVFDNYAANIRFGSNVITQVIAANVAWLGSSSYQAADPALTIVGNSGRIDMQALLYASGPYPTLAISAPELRINTKAAAAWSDGGSGFTGYGTERLRVNDAGLRVEAASALNFGDETADNAWRIVRSGNDLVIQRRVSGAWVTKQTVAG